MKAVILCGGFGTRFSEETKKKPKPMIKVGKYPILFHIMKTYESHGITDFILALGYKGFVIKKYFQDENIEKLNKGYNKHANIKTDPKKWNVTFCFSGLRTMTGGRLLRLKKLLKGEKNFLLTYGDGLSNVNIQKLIKFHNQKKKIATVTAVIPSARFGALRLKGDNVKKFSEKPQSGEGWINGGYFVFNEKVFQYLDNDKSVLEEKPLETLSKKNNLVAFKHKKYWQCMDTRREHDLLVEQWKTKKISWLKK